MNMRSEDYSYIWKISSYKSCCSSKLMIIKYNNICRRKNILPIPGIIHFNPLVNKGFFIFHKKCFGRRNSLKNIMEFPFCDIESMRTRDCNMPRDIYIKKTKKTDYRMS